MHVRHLQHGSHWYAVKVASKLVAKNGGGVISMSWGDPEASTDLSLRQTFH